LGLNHLLFPNKSFIGMSEFSFMLGHRAVFSIIMRSATASFTFHFFAYFLIIKKCLSDKRCPQGRNVLFIGKA